MCALSNTRPRLKSDAAAELRVRYSEAPSRVRRGPPETCGPPDGGWMIQHGAQKETPTGAPGNAWIAKEASSTFLMGVALACARMGSSILSSELPESAG